ncbi:MAG: hypothetical protein KAK00_03025 [Nanoarchaeota archaeon]|nr:hypothetical protein [Nanoarchaeota archaeon]
MGKAKRELLLYIRNCLNKDLSFKKIEDSLVKQGYPRRVAEGVILSYKYRGRLFKGFSIFLLVILFSVSIFISGSGIVGMVTLGYSRSFSDKIDLVVNSSSFYSWYPTDKGELVSAALTGNLIGTGECRVYIEKDNVKYLIFDSSKENFMVTDISSRILGEENIKHFDVVCEDSCILEGFDKSIYNLVFEIQDAILEIEKIHYDIIVDKEVEIVPEFLEIPSQKMNIGSILRVDLVSFFNASDDNVDFSFLAEDESINVTISNGAAELKPMITGKTYLYFIAEVDNIKFMSNLVEIDIADSDSEEIVETMIRGNFVRMDNELIENDKNISGKGFAFFVSALLLFIIVLLAILPSRYYNMNRLAHRIDKMNKEVRNVSGSLVEYNEMKSRFKGKGLSDSEKDKLIDNMEDKIKGISRKTPRLKKMQEFNTKCYELEEAMKKDKKAAKKAYGELRNIYLKLIEGRIRGKDKKILYRRMGSYYKKLKKQVSE